uniref:TYR_PHOSPHATASE_2 domain-containing protein n=1 Tax=Steinernema glaseri TaxID=37863 RepID=A0A1I8A3J0_9BILA
MSLAETIAIGDLQETALPKQRLDYGDLPKKWRRYVAVGSTVPGTPFLPFKTPLRPEFNRRLPEKEIFNVDTLLECVRMKNKRIGFVIDLTNTDRYYDSSLWGSNGIRYKKMPQENGGHAIHTETALFEDFKEAVDSFRKETNDELLIGVHCTHGLNRTGYLICRYMIEAFGSNVVDAILEFESSRGHMIRRNEYIEALKEVGQEKLSFDEAEWQEKMSETSRKASLAATKKTSWLEGLPKSNVCSIEH